MTLEEIDHDNELHDALILDLHHDYESAVVRLTVGFYVEGRDKRRSGVIEFGGVLYCGVDLPEPESSLNIPGDFGSHPLHEILIACLQH